MAGSDDLAEISQRLRREQQGTREREEWLEEMRRKVREGTYQVETEQLADDLLRKAFRKPPSE
ncbi:MAG TPA: flagellar biosynthesis anti-sigma factor FlgM [Bryobacteraceae bacterium]|nr:flagellar biosynthesis anti-sigma factor FlgM [Bryobacteraceae bacterium]